MLDERGSFDARSPTAPSTPDGAREVLTLAASNREEATRWYALLRDAISHHAERYTEERQKHAAQVKKVRLHMDMLKESYVTEKRREEAQKAEVEKVAWGGSCRATQRERERNGTGRKGPGRNGKGRKGKERKGKGRAGKERKEKGRTGKER